MRLQKFVLLPLILFVGFLVPACPAENQDNQAAPASDGSFWQEEMNKPEFQMPLSDERINMYMEHIRKKDTARADELEQLRTQDPDKFRSALRDEFTKNIQYMMQQRQGRMEGRPEGPDDRSGFVPGQGQGSHGSGFSGGQGGSRGNAPGNGPSQDRPMGQGQGQGYWKERLEKTHNDLISWLEKNYPDQAVQLKQLREKQPDEYVQQAAEVMRKYDPIRRAERENPKLAAVLKEDMECQRIRDELLKQYAAAKEADKEQIRAKLKDSVALRFDLIMAKKQLQYEDLRQRLEELQKEVKKREGELDQLKSNKQLAVDDHLAELLSKTKKVNWEQ